MMTREDLRKGLLESKEQLNAELNRMSKESGQERTQEEWKQFDETFTKLREELNEVNELLKYYR